ncbi:MAG: prepilin-type N-terminal cleavage/methylation domain-containing protein [Alphaproteobacteria bacterium]|nr:prepilin-type N-terminal cleavage/methylation domain-containing protein [Alphaproteobacteria bacterium]
MQQFNNISSSSLSSRQHGFTLMEISIVLVIIGILVGAVVSGQHLIHSMRLSKILESYQTYTAAMTMFTERYGALPGDIPNATEYWGEVSGTEGCISPGVVADGGVSGNSFASGTGTATCNGNDDDKIGDMDVPDLHHEMFRAWQHLYNAGLVSRAYTGVAGSTSSDDAEANNNIPTGALGGSGWTLMRIKDYTGDGGSANPVFNKSYGNVLIFGAEVDGDPTLGPILTPAEARNLDSKADDTVASEGVITVILDSASPTADCTSAAGDSNLTDVTYNTASEEIACALVFTLPTELRGPTGDSY